MNYWVRFWVVVLSLIVAISALGFLSLSFVFPDADPFGVGRVGRLAVALVGATAIGVVVWGASTSGEIITDNPRQ